MVSFKGFRERGRDALRRLDKCKFTILAPTAIAGGYMAATALTGIDYSENMAEGVFYTSLALGGFADIVRFIKDPSRYRPRY